ncbi:MAG: helix-turn-helix transcriptional regulator [Bacteroidales bacterium]|nr:helix-turn-helix transcriptional regulator [Bacteroidales bacterium]
MESVKMEILLSNVSLLDSVALLNGCGLLVLDHSKHNFFYVSSNIAYLYGIKASKIAAKGFDIYTEHVPSEDLSILQTINKVGIEKFESISAEERRLYSMSYDFHFDVDGKYVMLNHRVTPLTTKDGKIWLSLCIVSLSYRKTSGHIVLRNSDDNAFFEYNLHSHSWERKTFNPLSAKEKYLLHLVARGFTSKEIAEKVYKSEETIRAYRKALKKKLNTPNCIAALSQLASGCILQT